MRVGSLFSGIGGIELGLERTKSFETLWAAEIDPFARSILSKNWPGLIIVDDVKKVLSSDLPRIDLLCGGSPCQDVSNAKTAKETPKGLQGKKSGLWFEMKKIISATRPPLVLIENVAALRIRGLKTMLSNLDEDGYDAEWATVSAGALGAPHLRKRLFIVASLRGHNDGVVGNVFFPQPIAMHTWPLPPLELSKTMPKNKRLRVQALGNSVVPDCTTFIGYRIMRGIVSPKKRHGNTVGCLSSGTWREYDGISFMEADVLPELKQLPACGIMDYENGLTVLRDTGAWVHPKCKYRTPTARDWKGMTSVRWRTRTDGDNTPTLPDQLGGVAEPEWLESLMGFPKSWTKP